MKIIQKENKISNCHKKTCKKIFFNVKIEARERINSWISMMREGKINRHRVVSNQDTRSIGRIFLTGSPEKIENKY